MAESEGSEDQEGSLMPSSNKKVIAALLGVVVIVAGGFYAMNMMDTAPASNNEGDSQTADNSSAQETTSKVGLTASQIEGDITDVTLSDIKAEPASPQIAPEDGIRFVNQAGVDVAFSFDREIPNFQLAAGESIIVDPTSIVYYEVEAQDEDAEFRKISARINVQS